MKRLGLLLSLATAPALAQTQPKPSAADLLTALRAAPSEGDAAALEQQIEARWAEQASPAVRLLLSRGMRELSEGNPSDALDSFDAALDLTPELLEGWRGRATARRALGDYVGATHDIEQLLRLEPKSFAAFQELSRIGEARRDWRAALAAWQKLLEMDPHTPGGQARLQDLKRRALGEEL